MLILGVAKAGFRACESCGLLATLRSLVFKGRPLVALCGHCWDLVVNGLRENETRGLFEPPGPRHATAGASLADMARAGALLGGAAVGVILGLPPVPGPVPEPSKGVSAPSVPKRPKPKRPPR